MTILDGCWRGSKHQEIGQSQGLEHWKGHLDLRGQFQGLHQFPVSSGLDSPFFGGRRWRSGESKKVGNPKGPSCFGGVISAPSGSLRRLNQVGRRHGPRGALPDGGDHRVWRERGGRAPVRDEADHGAVSFPRLEIPQGLAGWKTGAGLRVSRLFRLVSPGNNRHVGGQHMRNPVTPGRISSGIDDRFAHQVRAGLRAVPFGPECIRHDR